MEFGMTGLYVICSEKPQEHLSRRRGGYREIVLRGACFYVREEHNSEMLGSRDHGRVRMLPQLIEDVRSVRDDPHASCFFVEQKGRETLEEALERGKELPVGRSTGSWLAVDEERRLASSL